MSESEYSTETIGEFRARNGAIVSNSVCRLTSNSLKFPKRDSKNSKFGKGHIVKIGDVDINKKTSLSTINDLLCKFPSTSKIIERYPTRFCNNCGRSSWQFIEFERRGHSTCKGCGMVQSSKRSHMGSLHLGDDEKANKSQWNITPGMDHTDTSLIFPRKNKNNESGSGARAPSHLRNYWRIRKKIDGIGGFWHFEGIDNIILSAKAKLKQFYYSVHRETKDDNNTKMPHGGAALASACFYCAVLEFEHRVQHKTPCSLPAIQEGAQMEVDRNKHRKTRDVTDLIILKYSKMLKKRGYCQVLVPEIGAETLKFKPTSAALEHSRMAKFADCRPVKFHLPMKGSWGMQVGDTKHGVLYCNNVDSCGIAFKTGLREGDYIFQFEGKTIGIEETPAKFLKRVVDVKEMWANGGRAQVELCIMRKKK